MNRMTMRGSGGQIKWAYHLAATLGPWTLSVDSNGGTVTANVVTQDAYAVSQQPLTFVVPRPKGQPWCWPVTTLQIANGTLTAFLGSQE